MKGQRTRPGRGGSDVDLRRRALAVTALRSGGKGRRVGVCPRCGKLDTFHVGRTWFYCEACHPRRSGPGAWRRFLGRR